MGERDPTPFGATSVFIRVHAIARAHRPTIFGPACSGGVLASLRGCGSGQDLRSWSSRARGAREGIPVTFTGARPTFPQGDRVLRSCIVRRRGIVTVGSHRMSALWVATLAALATGACGGKLLTVSGPAPDASSAGDDAGGAAATGEPAGSSSGGSSGAGVGSSGGIVGSSGGSSSSGGTTGAVCMNAAECPTGQVCCGTISLSTACTSGPCPMTPLGPVQLCTSSAECRTPGAQCGPLPRLPTLPVKSCNVPTIDGGICSTTCTGCCDAQGVCNAGADDLACGSAGESCTDCTMLGGSCDGRTCQALTAE